MSAIICNPLERVRAIFQRPVSFPCWLREAWMPAHAMEWAEEIRQWCYDWFGQSYLNGGYGIKSVKPTCSTKQTTRKQFLSISDVLTLKSLSPWQCRTLEGKPHRRANPIGGPPPSMMNSLKIAMMHLCSRTLTLWMISLPPYLSPMAQRQHRQVTSGSGKAHQKGTNTAAQHVSSWQYKYWKSLLYVQY